MNREDAVWERLSGSFKEYTLALQAFSGTDIDRVSLLRSKLNSKDRSTAISCLQYLSQVELTQLFPQLVFLASFSHGAVGTIREIILSLPRDWVLINIEEAAEPHLQNGTYDEYRRFLELYIQLDRDLSLKLVRRAAVNQDIDVREAGEEFIQKYNLSLSSATETLAHGNR